MRFWFCFFFNLGLHCLWQGLICCQSLSLNSALFTLESINKFNLVAWDEISWCNAVISALPSFLEGPTKALKFSFCCFITLPTWLLSISLPVSSATALVLSALPGRFLAVFFLNWAEHTSEPLKCPVCPHEKQITFLPGHFRCSCVGCVHVQQDIFLLDLRV